MADCWYYIIETPSVPVSVAAIATGLTPPIAGQKNTELECYKKAAIYFSCGLRLLRDKIDDVPPYTWGDNTPAMCPYCAQLREGKWPDNFPSLGQAPFLELLDQMTKNASQILQGPTPDIHDILGMSALSDADLFNLPLLTLDENDDDLFDNPM